MDPKQRSNARAFREPRRRSGRAGSRAALLAVLFATAARPVAAETVAASASAASEVGGPAESYRLHCAGCHGERRYGGYAPPLIPATLARKGDPLLEGAIRDGLPSTQMPAFGGMLAPDEVRALVAWLRRPAGEIVWNVPEIANSRVELERRAATLPASVARENLILVVERGTGSVAVLDGATLEELDRFPVGRIHGGIKFDLGHRRAYASTRDGTLSEYDLERGGLLARIKAGVNTRNVAVSPDGRFVAAANQLPQGVVVLDGDLRPLARIPVDGQPSGVYPIPGRNAFLLGLRDVPELHTIRLPDLQVERVGLPEPFEDFVLVPGTRQLVASSRGGNRLLLYDLDARQVRGELETRGLPHLFSACFFSRDGLLHAAFNHMGAARLSIVDMQTFQLVETVPLAGSGFFARTHAATPWLWVDTNTEEIQLVDKETLRLADTSLVPEPGKKAMHVEFTAAGDKALVSVWDPQGAVVAYDARSLEEIARIPYSMPVGKYNPANKTRALRAEPVLHAD